MYPFALLYSGVSLLKLKSRIKGTLIVNGLLANLVSLGVTLHLGIMENKKETTI